LIIDTWVEWHSYSTLSYYARVFTAVSQKGHVGEPRKLTARAEKKNTSLSSIYLGGSRLWSLYVLRRPGVGSKISINMRNVMVGVERVDR